MFNLGLGNAGISFYSSAGKQSMRGNLIHFVDSVFEGGWVHAPRGQYGVKDRPADAGTGEREQMLFFV
jgi:hypothetical protein